MPRVPQYQQQVSVQNLPSARVQNAITPEALGAGVGRGLQQVAGVVQQFAQQEQEKADVAAIMDADRQLADLELNLFNDPENGAYAKRGRDAFGLPEQVFPAWDKAVGDIEGRLTPTQRQAFQRQAQSRRTDLQRGLSRHIAQESDRYYSDESKAYVLTAVQSAAANYTDPERVDLEAERAARGILSSPEMRGASPIVQNAAIKQARASVYGGVVERLLAGNPAAAVDYFESMRDNLTADMIVRLEPKIADARNTTAAVSAVDRAMYGIAGFDSAVEAVLEAEGGYVADDAGAGETNFGINIRANPDVDVKNLTRDGAKEIYRKRYWDAIGAEALPPELQAIAFDAAVNQGVGNAKKWIAESGGDPAAFARLRREHYAGLVARDPEKYQQYAAGWEARVAKFERAGEQPSEAEVLRRLSTLPPEQRTMAETEATKRLRIQRAAEAEAREEAVNAAYAHIQGGGSIADMPPEVRQAIRPTDMATVEQYARVRAQNAPGDRTVFNEIADLATLRPLQFAEPGFLEAQRPNLSDDDYQELVNARRKIRAGQDDEFVSARRTQEAITRAAMVQLGYAERPARQDDPLKPKSGREDAVNAFRDALAQRVDARIKADGKIPNEAEVQAIADELLVKQVVTTVKDWWPDSTDEVPTFERFPVAPRTAAERTVGTVYLTPRGPLQWTGRGWREAPSG